MFSCFLMYYAIRLCRLINAVVSYAHKPVK
nr:MAG TPA: hypothetical protein [Caudoviricetes sp.]DAQ91201.1 MAG TPA: hypothetical protein [Caudoviricetes sp.]